MRLLGFGLVCALSASVLGQTYTYHYEMTRYGSKPGPHSQTPEQKMKMLGEAGLRYATDDKKNLQLFRAEAQAEQEDQTVSGKIRVSASDSAIFFESPFTRLIDHRKPQFEVMPTWFSGTAIVEPHRFGGQRPGQPVDILTNVRDADDPIYVSNLAISAALTNKVPSWWTPVSGPWKEGEVGYDFTHGDRENYVIVKKESGRITQVVLTMDKQRRVRYHTWIVNGNMDVGRTVTYRPAGDWGNVKPYAQSYKLVGIEPASMTDLARFIPVGESVYDLRLKDGNDKVESRKLSTGHTLYTLPSVDYKWDGHLPTIDELRKIDDQAHTEPREPSSLAVAYWPVLGICGALGAFTLRHPRRIRS